MVKFLKVEMSKSLDYKRKFKGHPIQVINDETCQRCKEFGNRFVLMVSIVEKTTDSSNCEAYVWADELWSRFPLFFCFFFNLAINTDY